MHRIAIGALVVASTVAACGGRTYDTPGTTSLTSADVPATNGDSVADRIARAVCIHEVECGRVRDPGLCIDRARMQTGRELAAWTCDETSARVSAEQCLASVRTAPCSVEIAAGSNVCPQNGGCASIESDPAASR